MPAADDEPIDHVDDARRAIRRKIDSLTDASNTFRARRGVNPEDVAGAAIKSVNASSRLPRFLST